MVCLSKWELFMVRYSPSLRSDVIYQELCCLLCNPHLCKYSLMPLFIFFLHSHHSGLILLFYAALYLFLAAMFGGCLFCLMWSISPYHPTFNDRVMPPGNYNSKLKPPPLFSVPLAVLLSVASPWISAQLTVSASPLAGMTMAPHLEGHEIAFNASDRKSWRKYARSMEEYLRREWCDRGGVVKAGRSDKVVEFL